MPDENFINASGVILSRKPVGENKLWLKLFLKGNGIINVAAPENSSSRPRLGGDTEPFIWGTFFLRKNQKGRNFFIEDIETSDDMFFLRRRPEALLISVNWSKKIIKYLMPEQPDDYLLANLYWNMKLLSDSVIPVDAVNWRFLWRWLEIWGIAPDIINFYASRKFNPDEINLLLKISKLDTQNVRKLFSEKLSANIRENVFKVASKCCTGFFYEK